MSNPMATPGAFSWVELMTNDVDGAKQFYGQLFGWTFKDPGMGGYQIIELNGQMAGGVMPMPKGCPSGPAWGNYVTVASADETCAKVATLGGKVLSGPEDIPTVGRFAVVQDPQGAVFMVMQWARK